MVTFQCNKLVRDRTFERMEQRGVRMTYRTITGEELQKAFLEKLVEESHEVAEAPNREKVLSELADVLEVIDGLYRAYGLSPDEVHVIKERKLKERGGFDQGIFSESIEMDDNNPVVDYCRTYPHKYKEI